jgi:hypothetical protein
VRLSKVPRRVVGELVGTRIAHHQETALVSSSKRANPIFSLQLPQNVLVYLQGKSAKRGVLKVCVTVYF